MGWLIFIIILCLAGLWLSKNSAQVFGRELSQQEILVLILLAGAAGLALGDSKGPKGVERV
jgi:hypothetical protein